MPYWEYLHRSLHKWTHIAVIRMRSYLELVDHSEAQVARHGVLDPEGHAGVHAVVDRQQGLAGGARDRGGQEGQEGDR